MYPLVLQNDSLYRDGTDYHEKELFRFERAYEALGRPTGKKVLDVGSYPGTAFHVFGKTNRYTAFGILYPEYTDALTRARLPYIQGDIQDYRAQSDADVILFTEIIEHLQRPYDALKNLFAVAKPGALVYVTTNNASYYGYILKLLFNREIHHSITTQATAYPGHTRYFGLEELARELAGVGFEIMSKRYVNFLPAARYYRSRGFAMMKNALGAIVPARHSTNIEVVVRKP